MSTTGIVDVARKASVSVATVSRVFNHPGTVTGATRDAVLAAAQSLNYSPNTTARNLRGSRKVHRKGLTHTIGFLVHRETLLHGDPFAFEVLTAVESALCERGLGIRIIPATAGGNLPREIAEKEVDGVISRFASPLGQLVAQEMPVVMLDYSDPAAKGFAVVPDYAGGLQEVMKRLFAAGHRNVALLAFDPKTKDLHNFWITFPTTCIQAYEKHGIPVPPRLCRGAAASAREGYEAGCRIFDDRANLPSAIIGPDGAMLGLYRAAAERGLKIPEDISVIGINGLQYGEYLHPPLTTVDVQISSLVQTAIRILAESLASGVRRQGLEVMPVVLRERTSARI